MLKGWRCLLIVAGILPSFVGSAETLPRCAQDINDQANQRILAIRASERARAAERGAFAETLERFAQFDIQKSFERLRGDDRLIIAGAADAQLAYEYLTHSADTIHYPLSGSTRIALPPARARAKVQAFDYFPLSNPSVFHSLINAGKFEFLGGKLLKEIDDRVFVGATMVICEFGPTCYIPNFSETIPRYLSWLKKGGELYVALEMGSLMVRHYADAQGNAYLKPIERPLAEVLNDFYQNSEGVRFESASLLFGHPLLKFTILDATKVSAPQFTIDEFDPRTERNLPPRIILKRSP